MTGLEHALFYHAGDTRTVTRAHLPHWNRERTLQFVTFRLADSLPKSKRDLLIAEREAWLLAHPKPWDDQTKQAYMVTFETRLEQWLDRGYGACILARQNIRTIVEDALHYSNGRTYRLHAYVIMPNHVHLLLETLPLHTLPAILRNLKGYTGRHINHLLSQEGAVWQKESFDRMIRSPAHYDRVVRYIEQNPHFLPKESASCVIYAQLTEDDHYRFPDFCTTPAE